MGRVLRPRTPEPKHRLLTKAPISDCDVVLGTTGITHVRGGGWTKRGQGNAERIGEGRGWIGRKRARTFHSGYNKQNQNHGFLHVTASGEPRAK